MLDNIITFLIESWHVIQQFVYFIVGVSFTILTAFLVYSRTKNIMSRLDKYLEIKEKNTLFSLQGLDYYYFIMYGIILDFDTRLVQYSKKEKAPITNLDIYIPKNQPEAEELRRRFVELRERSHKDYVSFSRDLSPEQVEICNKIFKNIFNLDLSIKLFAKGIFDETEYKSTLESVKNFKENYDIFKKYLQEK